MNKMLLSLFSPESVHSVTWVWRRLLESEAERKVCIKFNIVQLFHQDHADCYSTDLSSFTIFSRNIFFYFNLNKIEVVYILAV